MQEINVSELKPHPKNDYFFDDIQGENWDAFLESVKTSGVIEPIIVDAKTKTIVSGHQRVRACKELEIQKVLCEVRIYDNEDKILKDLLETNLRQRGIGNTNPIKLGRCLRELERIYGVRQGSSNPKGTNIRDLDNTSDVTQEQIAQQYNISIDKYRNAEKLLNLIPELQDMVQENKVSATVASRIIARLSPTDQKQLILTYGKDEIENATQTKTQQMIDEMQRLKNVNAGYEIKLQKVHELENQISNLKQELDNRPTVEKTVEVKPDDYDNIKESLNGYQKDYSNLESDYNKKVKELSELKQQLESIKSVAPEEQYSKKLKDSTIFFCARVNDFIEKTGGFTWLSDHIMELPNPEKDAYIKAVDLIENWATAIKQNMKQYLN